MEFVKESSTRTKVKNLRGKHLILSKIVAFLFHFPSSKVAQKFHRGENLFVVCETKIDMFIVKEENRRQKRGYLDIY